jgi:uncharacterized membrane protein
MRTYQTLSLIGCIIGIFLSLALIGLVGFLGGTSDVLLNFSESIDPTNPQTIQQRQEFERQQASTNAFIAGSFLSFFMYIALIPITFATKNKTKAVGVILLVIGFITILITNGWGIISYALLLPAGILALRFKKQKVRRRIVEEEVEEEESEEDDTTTAKK